MKLKKRGRKDVVKERMPIVVKMGWEKEMRRKKINKGSYGHKGYVWSKYRKLQKRGQS